MRAIGYFFIVILIFSYARAHPYFNSSENGCDPENLNPNYVLCDDFEDGSWYTTCNDPAAAANDGWLGCNGTSLRNPPPPAAVCGGKGAVGSSCTAASTLVGGDGGDSALAMHGLYPNNATYDEIWVRYYIKFSDGYVFNNNQKFISFIGSAYQGGIDLGGGPTRALHEILFAPMWDCLDDNYTNPQTGFTSGHACYLNQNLGKNLILQTKKWYFIEFHIKANTYSVRNGVLEVWADDCGFDGLACSGMPTKRTHYTNIGWKGSGSWGATSNKPLFGSMWFDIWGNPSDIGTIHIDQLIVSKQGTIGFAGGPSGNTLLAPKAPTGLKVQ